jgi:hypothetical protein
MKWTEYLEHMGEKCKNAYIPFIQEYEGMWLLWKPGHNVQMDFNGI